MQQLGKCNEQFNEYYIPYFFQVNQKHNYHEESLKACILFLELYIIAKKKMYFINYGRSQLLKQTQNTMGQRQSKPLKNIDKHRIIPIQKLKEKKSLPHLHPPTEEQILTKFNEKINQQEDDPFKKPSAFQVFCYKDTSNRKTQRLSEYQSFFGAFFQAYNQHGNILLVPDDVWLMITLFLSKYIDKNAEKLRSQLVKHQGKKELIIYEFASSEEKSIQLEKQWDFFFKEIIKQIQENTVEGVVDLLKCDFSTTNQVYELISTSIIMSSLKQFFDYTRCITKCGISSVYFDGTIDDWKKLKDKLNSLSHFDVDGVLKKYIKHMDRILDEFICTFKGKVDVGWWNKIMTPKYPSSGEGTVDGWILHFFGIYERVSFGEIPETVISVPIKLVNDLTGITKNLDMITDWISISNVDEKTLKPDIGVAIIEKK